MKRFWDKVKKADGCWLWLGAKSSSGYGSFRVGGRMISAHRVSYELRNGPIVNIDGYHGTCILHKCDNKICVNPNHLFSGSQLDNMRDAIKKDRMPYGEKSKRCKLTEAIVVSMRKDYATGRFSTRKIAAKYGISPAHASNLVARKQWKHLV